MGLAAGLVCLLAMPAPALAQYQWTDENGRMVYSDVPPPPGSRVSNLIRRGERQRHREAGLVVDDKSSDDGRAATMNGQQAGTGGSVASAPPGVAPTVPATADAAAAASALPGDAALPASARGEPVARGAQAAQGAHAAQAAAHPPSLAEQEMAFRKRRAEKAEAEQKQLAQAEADRRLARACSDARSNLSSLESGMPISRTNEAGEHVFLSDEERESRLREVRSDLAARC